MAMARSSASRPADRNTWCIVSIPTVSPIGSLLAVNRDFVRRNLARRTRRRRHALRLADRRHVGLELRFQRNVGRSGPERRLRRSQRRALRHCRRGQLLRSGRDGFQDKVERTELRSAARLHRHHRWWRPQRKSRSVSRFAVRHDVLRTSSVKSVWRNGIPNNAVGW